MATEVHAKERRHVCPSSLKAGITESSSCVGTEAGIQAPLSSHTSASEALLRGLGKGEQACAKSQGIKMAAGQGFGSASSQVSRVGEPQFLTGTTGALRNPSLGIEDDIKYATEGGKLSPTQQWERF